MRTLHPLLPLLVCAVLAACSHVDKDFSLPGGAIIYPDYAGVTVPPSICPLDFVIADSTLASAHVKIKGEKSSFTVHAHQGVVRIPLRRWHRLLRKEAGNTLTISFGAHSFPIHISTDDIDYGLNYRLIAPGYEVYSHMGIYERDLTSFRERPLIENTQFLGCVNCHAYNRGNPENFSLHIRGDHGATLLRHDGRLDAYNTRTDSTLGFCVYPYWHPSGRYIAYSTNNTRQGFHVQQDKLVEVFDLASDMQVYDVGHGEIITVPHLKRDSVWETFPAFSSDGKTLYYCAATARPIPSEVALIRYNLCSVPFDASKGTFGNRIDTLIYAEAEEKSISFPKPSYNGRYLLYTLSDYGNFSIWHHEADLWLLDLATGERRSLGTCEQPSPKGETVNSNDTESYHSWSSNSRWFVFSSRRDDGLHTRLYLCHIADDGTCGKPFMLPQRNPRHYYDAQFRSYNVPEFVMAPVRFPRNHAERLINSPRRTPFVYRSTH